MGKAKKVVLAIFSLQGNGAERVVQTLARSMRTKGHETHIVIFKNNIDFPVDENVKIHYFPYKNFRGFPRWIRRGIASRAFDRFVLKNIGKVDLLLSNLYPVDFILSKSRMANKFFIMHSTASLEYDIQDVNDPTISKLLATYGGKNCICVSEGVKADMDKLFSGKINTQTIYNPIEPETCRQLAEKEGPKLTGYIIHVGKFTAAKRHDRLLRAYAMSGVEIPLVLLGNGPLQSDAEALVKELGISNRVHFAGFQPNPFPWIKSARLMVVSSDFEGLGMNILEALSLGLPVVSTNFPSGAAEILPAKNLVETQDENALANLIRSAVENPENYECELPGKFEASNVADQYLKLAV